MRKLSKLVIKSKHIDVKFFYYIRRFLIYILSYIYNHIFKFKFLLIFNTKLISLSLKKRCFES